MEPHRIHASPAAGKGGNSVDIGPLRWRGDGGTQDGKRAVARRIAVCWNVLEGWRTEDLEGGVLREVDELTRELVAALLAGAGNDDSNSVENLARLLSAALARRDERQDMRDGRPHDCRSCQLETTDER